jgi:hypothetical protein
MFSQGTKKYISDEVQKILQKVLDSELPTGEINFILHVDGAQSWSWANIRNESDRSIPVPDELVQNISIQ